MIKIKLNMALLKENENEAEKLNNYFTKNGVFAINLMGSPGCGKTTLLEKVIKALKKEIKIAVIEGDVATGRDAVRIKKLGVPVSLLNTDMIGNACHLSSKMVKKAFSAFKNRKVELLIIENIGNLVCPAEFDLGEHIRLSMTSIAEGDDKISKYPPMFINCNAIIIGKTDLMDHFRYNMKQVDKDIKRLNPKAKIFKVDLTREKTLVPFLEYLKDAVKTEK